MSLGDDQSTGGFVLTAGKDKAQVSSSSQLASVVCYSEKDKAQMAWSSQLATVVCCNEKDNGSKRNFHHFLLWSNVLLNNEPAYKARQNSNISTLSHGRGERDSPM